MIQDDCPSSDLLLRISSLQNLGGTNHEVPLLASFARPTVHHRFDAAGVLLRVAVFAGGGGGGHDAALLLLHVDGRFLDVGGEESAE